MSNVFDDDYKDGDIKMVIPEEGGADDTVMSLDFAEGFAVGVLVNPDGTHGKEVQETVYVIRIVTQDKKEHEFMFRVPEMSHLTEFCVEMTLKRQQAGGSNCFCGKCEDDE